MTGNAVSFSQTFSEMVSLVEITGSRLMEIS